MLLRVHIALDSLCKPVQKTKYSYIHICMLFTKQIVIRRYKLFNYGQHIVPYSRRVWQGKSSANDE